MNGSDLLFLWVRLARSVHCTRIWFPTMTSGLARSQLSGKRGSESRLGERKTPITQHPTTQWKIYLQIRFHRIPKYKARVLSILVKRHFNCLSSSEHLNLCACKVALILSGAVFDTSAKWGVGSARFLALALSVRFCLCSYLAQLGHCWLQSDKPKHSLVLQKSKLGKALEVTSSSSKRGSAGFGITWCWISLDKVDWFHSRTNDHWFNFLYEVSNCNVGYRPKVLEIKFMVIRQEPSIYRESKAQTMINHYLNFWENSIQSFL